MDGSLGDEKGSPCTPTHSRLQSLTSTNMPLSTESKSGTSRSASDVNVKVYVRIKPLQDDSEAVIHGEGAAKLVCTMQTETSSYEFDRVWGADCGQADVFDDLSYLIKSAVDGYNVSILTYGQTGSGKTHTLIGDIRRGQPVSAGGVIPHTASKLFHLLHSHEQSNRGEVRITMSAVEIYCEKIRDLLCFDDGSENLSMTQDKDGSVRLPHAKQVHVYDDKHMLEIVQEAMESRAVASTHMNTNSSRSHCLIFVHISRKNRVGTWMETSKLSLIDLAGSERQQKTGAKGQVLEEAKLINKSLSALGNVISSLTDPRKGKSGGSHVPFRDSKLTRILQDSLGGTARTAIVLCVSASSADLYESMSCLRFGLRAKSVVNSVQATSQLAPTARQACVQRPGDSPTKTDIISPEASQLDLLTSTITKVMALLFLLILGLTR